MPAPHYMTDHHSEKKVELQLILQSPENCSFPLSTSATFYLAVVQFPERYILSFMVLPLCNSLIYRVIE